MNPSILTWLLGGALAASLAWNLRPDAAVAPAADCGACTSSGVDCAQALATLDLTGEQQRALKDWSRTACGRAEEAAATRAAQELCALLAAPELDTDRARSLALEAGRLRGEALRACVDSVAAVRRVLTPQQTARLLRACCTSSGECAPLPAGPMRDLGYPGSER